MPFFAIAAKAGTNFFDIILDSRLRGNDPFIFMVCGQQICHVKFVWDLACLREAPPPEALRRAGAPAEAGACHLVLTHKFMY